MNALVLFPQSPYRNAHLLLPLPPMLLRQQRQLPLHPPALAQLGRSLQEHRA